MASMPNSNQSVNQIQIRTKTRDARAKVLKNPWNCLRMNQLPMLTAILIWAWLT